ncbi:spindle and kinetochore-associated protein 3 isoform X2 [Kryptolebias marmoratus]|uniref:spindle and kinetochore-associated protein 3 isoform X2 n=1 Tax=Kryptolebias marmoratus TaxID=37003 RepID=UPI000D5310BE|nr:spindle and kinetochore-associated protein 3 isoform X2 [Kryptolebias marmoratus]
MDPTREFFSRLRKMAVTLETETARLQRIFENRNEDGDSETTARAMRAYHDLNCEVGSLKEQILDQLAEQKEQENEVSSFINACRVMEQRVSKDIQTVRTHLEKYGYQAPCDSQRPELEDREAEAESKVSEEDTGSSAVGEDGNLEEDGGTYCSSPLQKMEQLFTDVMRTPQLSDFGLSEMQFKRALTGAEWCSEVPPMPEINLLLPSLKTPAPPTMATTPKCTLRMDDDVLQTPQMHDFGISEQTACLNNDYTMDLFREKVQKPERDPQDPAAPTVTSEKESVEMKFYKLKSPEPPSIFTPGFKIIKPNGQCFTPDQDRGDPGGSFPSCSPPSTPEVPPFQTPYVKRLVSAKKRAQPEPDNMQSDGDDYTFKLETPRNGSKHMWEYKVPEVSIFDVEEKQVPEMPHLESFLGNYLQIKNGNVPKLGENDKGGKDTAVNSLELDGPTQEFRLGTPRIRMTYQEPSTPEMPDLSSVTQDICKVRAPHPNQPHLLYISLHNSSRVPGSDEKDNLCTPAAPRQARRQQTLSRPTNKGSVCGEPQRVSDNTRLPEADDSEQPEPGNQQHQQIREGVWWGESNVHDGGAKEDQQRGDHGSCVHPLPEGAEEAETGGRHWECRRLQTDNTQLKTSTLIGQS